MSEDRNNVAGGDPPEDEIEILDDPEPPEDDELPEEPEEPPEPDPEPALPPAARQRGSARVQALANENRELRAKQADFERQLRELTQARRAPTPAELAETERVERERFEMLSPWDQAQYMRNSINGAVSAQVNQIATNLWDQNDRTQYEALTAANPKLKRYDAAVQELMKSAPNISRTVLLDYAIGKAAREGLARAETRSGRRTQGERDQQRATPSNGRADVPAERRRSGGSVAERLRGQSI